VLQVIPAHRVLQEQTAQLDPKGHRDRKDQLQQEPLEFQELVGLKDLRVQLGLTGHKVRMVPEDHKDHKALKGRLDKQAIQEVVDHKVHGARKDHRVL
jgi:hypothetical protein